MGTASSASGAPVTDLVRIPVSRIRPNPFQPRRDFAPAELAELEASLKASGLLQPITVRRQGDAYEIIAGERRLRAASNLEWAEISAIVRELDDRTMLVLALVENLQRANLNAIEEARGYRRLIEDFQLTQLQVADAVGKDRTTVTNLLRVLTLPDEIQQMVEKGLLSAGHARALLSLGPEYSMIDLANAVVAGGLSVRELETRVREAPGAQPSSSVTRRSRGPATDGSPVIDPAVSRIQDDLRKYLQTDVRIHVNAESRGRLEVSFYSTDDLERLLDLILRENRRDF